MNTVVAFPSSTVSLDVFAQHLKISHETKSGIKNLLNMPGELMEFAYNLPILAMDELTQNDGRIDLAYTFEGAAALCSLVLVHDNEELAALGGALFDGHALLISLPELNTQLEKGVEHMQRWLRDGCGACAAQALGLQRDTSWTYAPVQKVRPIMQKNGVVGWSPNAQQDAYRFASAISQLSGGLDAPNVPSCVLDSGVANEEWASVLRAWEQFHSSKEWNAIRTQKAGLSEIGRLLGKTINSLETRILDHRFIQVVVRAFTNRLTEADKIAVSYSAAENVDNTEQIENIISAMGSITGDTSITHEQQHEDLWKEMTAHCCYARFLQNGNLADLIAGLALYIDDFKHDHDVLRKALLDNVGQHTYTQHHIEILARYQPHTLLKIDLPTPDDGTVVQCMFEKMSDVAFASVDVVKSALKITVPDYFTLLTGLVEQGWGGFNLDLGLLNNQKVWLRFLNLSRAKGEPATKHLPALFAAANTHAPHFSTHLCAILMNAEYDNSAITQMLIDSGVDWNYTRQQKSLAQLMFANPNMPLPIKTQARRALQENGLPENVIPFARKQ